MGGHVDQDGFEAIADVILQSQMILSFNINGLSQEFLYSSLVCGPCL